MEGQASSSSQEKDADWPNIFAECKLIVSMNRDTDNGLQIIHADDTFRNTFGFDQTERIPFSRMIGAASSPDARKKIDECVLRGRTAHAYINLYKRDDTPLSCHLSIFAIRGTSQFSVAEVAEQGTGSGLDCFNVDGSVSSPGDERWACITIRSAAVVGHAKLSAMGLLGADAVTEDAKKAYFKRLNVTLN